MPRRLVYWKGHNEMMKYNVIGKIERIISEGPDLMFEFNFYISELFNLKILMKKFQQTQLNITTSISGHC